MTQEELLTLEQLLIKLDNGRNTFTVQTFQVGRYIIQPIYWGEDDEDGIFVDEDSIKEEFKYFVDNELSMDFVEDTGR
jgi:hypothetical protein